MAINTKMNRRIAVVSTLLAASVYHHAVAPKAAGEMIGGAFDTFATDLGEVYGWVKDHRDTHVDINNGGNHAPHHKKPHHEQQKPHHANPAVLAAGNLAVAHQESQATAAQLVEIVLPQALATATQQ